MRNKLFAVTLVALFLALALCGCNPKNGKTEEGVTYGDIYTTHAGISEYTKATLVVSLPAGIEPYTGASSSADYTNAYMEDSNLMICKKTFTPEGASQAVTRYGAYMIDKQAFIGDGVVYTEFGVSYGTIVFADESGNCLLYKTDGTALIDAEDGKKVSAFGETSASKVIIPIGEKYYVVRHDGNKYGTDALYLFDIYRMDGTPVLTESGATFSLKSKHFGKSTSYYNTLTFGLKSVDDYIVSNSYYVSGSTIKLDTVLVFDAATGKQIYNAFAERGSMDSSTQTRAAYYLGNGKWYCYQQETSTKADGYTYTYNEKYYKILIWIYDVVSGEKSNQSADIIYYEIINKYNSGETTIKDIGYYVNDGYSLGNIVYLRNADKTVDVDQYIVDSDLRVYVSFYTHAGTAVKYSANNDAARDVVLTFIGDIGFSTDASDTNLMVYDDKGNAVFNKKGYFSNVFYNNGIVTALQTFYNADGTKKYSYYAAFNIDGTEIFDAETRAYSEFSAYVGSYALARTSDGKVYLVDKTGVEVRDITWEVYTYGGKLYYKTGAYVTYSGSGSTRRYGLKSYEGTVIFENNFAYHVIDKRGINKILFYAKDTDGRWYLYFIE